MEFRQSHPQRLAAAKSGISERTARRIETNRHFPASPVANRPLRRQGPDPFDGLWDSEIRVHFDWPAIERVAARGGPD